MPLDKLINNRLYSENLYIKDKRTSEQIGCEIVPTYLKTNGKPTQLFCFSVLW